MDIVIIARRGAVIAPAMRAMIAMKFSAIINGWAQVHRDH
jgi:hypothetical protein